MRNILLCVFYPILLHVIYVFLSQLILSVVGVPSLEFMSTITSDRVRNYIGRLPHKEPVAFSKIYPNKAPEAIDLLSQFLVLDPRKRISVEQALKHSFLTKYGFNAFFIQLFPSFFAFKDTSYIPFIIQQTVGVTCIRYLTIFSRYHDLDDEPTSPLFAYDLESIPMDKNVLRQHILKEILEYHSKRPKPKLAPVQTEFPKPFPLATAKNQVIPENETTQTIISKLYIACLFSSTIIHSDLQVYFQQKR